MVDVHPFYGRVFEPHIISTHRIIFIISREGEGWIGRTRGKEFAHSACHPLLRSNNFPTSAKLILRERESLSLSRSVWAIAWSKLKRTNGERSRAIKRALYVEPRRTFRHPRGLFVRSPTVHSQPLIPTEGFRSKGTRPATHNGAGRLTEGSKGCTGYVPGIAGYLSITDTWGKTR